MGDPNFEMPPTTVGDLTEDDKLWAMLAHLSGLIGLSFIGPLIIWVVKKDSSVFVEQQAKEALNFQLSMVVSSLVVTVTCVGAVLLPVIIIGGIVYAVIAGMAANRGEAYKYPYTFRMIN